MLKVQCDSPKKLIFKDVPEPDLRNGEALIDVKSVGLCATDIAPFKGRELEILPLPMVQGHEFGGEILELNGESEYIRKGDKVVVYPMNNCGSCYYCSNNLELSCPNQRMFGSPKLDGAMAEKIAVPQKNCIKMSEDFDIRYGGLIEPVAVANHTLAGIQDSNVLIVGAGSIGMIMVEIAKYKNNKVIAVDIDGEHLKLAKELGADFAVNFNNINKNENIKSFLKDELIDVVVFTFVNQEISDWAINLVKTHGLIVQMAITSDPIEVDYFKILLKAINIRGSCSYHFNEFLEAVKFVEKGVISREKIVTKMFSFNEKGIKEAYSFKANNNTLKVLIVK